MLDDYYVAGTVIAMSLCNNGPAPKFFSRLLFDAIVHGPDHVAVDTDALPDSPLKEEIRNVISAVQIQHNFKGWLCRA